MAHYTARICWNTNGWRFPSGEGRPLENGTYVAKYGFGHEEWLFNYSWTLGGYHYSFLQPINRSHDRFAGETLSVLLYTIDKRGTRQYVGEIRQCEVLTAEESKRNLRLYRKKGWVRDMIRQVGEVGGDSRTITGAGSALDILNIRFRPSDAEIYPHAVPATPNDAVQGRHRYVLAPAGKRILNQWRRGRKARSAPLSPRTIKRAGTNSVEYDPLHNKLQAAAYELLSAKYGKRNVRMEENNVDLTIKKRSGVVLIEIKTDPDARMAVRHAIGQLLEYGYLWDEASCDKRPLELAIVAPAPQEELVTSYLARLRRSFRLPFTYHHFDLESASIDL